MPAVAPPFPVAGNPHVDFEVRELYRRLGTVERVLRTSAPSPAPVPASVKVVTGKVVYCARDTLYYDQGWGTYGKLWGGYAIYLLKLFPPSLVLSVIAYVSDLFENNQGTSRPFGPFTLTDIEPNELMDSIETGVPILPPYARYWGGELDVDPEYSWESSPIVIDFVVSRPFGGGYWHNVGRYQRTGRRGGGRHEDIGALPYLPFTCGYGFGGVPFVTAEVGRQWQPGMRGSVTFIAMWIDSLVSRIATGVPIREAVLFAVKPVKAGPR